MVSPVVGLIDAMGIELLLATEIYLFRKIITLDSGFAASHAEELCRRNQILKQFLYSCTDHES